jgi:hypothetical protein
MEDLNSIVNVLIRSQQPNAISKLSVELSNGSDGQDFATLAQNLNAAFLMVLAGDGHPQYLEAKTYLEKLANSPVVSDLATFYLQGLQLIATEVQQAKEEDSSLATRFQQVNTVLANPTADAATITKGIWSVLFPEGTGINGQEADSLEQLQKQRIVTIKQLNPDPIHNPFKQVLFTSNALLTTPLPGADLSKFDTDFQTQVAAAAEEPQAYWYDHPIPIGVPLENDEILYGLKHLNAAMEFERQRHPETTDRLNCVLSVSVTHKPLQTLGKSYLKQVLAASEPLDQLNLFAFTEADTEALVQQVLLPIVKQCCPTPGAEDLLAVFGVDGRYGRHYSFLKAITPLWQVLIDPEMKATFKIDLDQVFPQAELLEQTGATALEHLQTPLWGATGLDSDGHPIELGMIAGALVNQKDIHQGVFTPDVKIPTGDLEPDEHVFFSKLPQAISTQAEMMTRYEPGTVPDGETTCLQRIHVTGGTNGILVDSLRRFQTFTPSFIGRAEDQAYMLSSLHQSERLGYAHASGLIMRHDKEGFAQEAIAMAKVGKQIGDYVRILMFSAYARALPPATAQIKAMTQPFTGCFISQLPVTVALLRFTLKVATLFQAGDTKTALEFIKTGVPQLQEALDFIQGNPSQLQRCYGRELNGWQLFYQALEGVEKGLKDQAPWALDLQAAAQKIVADCRIN